MKDPSAQFLPLLSLLPTRTPEATSANSTPFITPTRLLWTWESWAGPPPGHGLEQASQTRSSSCSPSQTRSFPGDSSRRRAIESLRDFPLPPPSQSSFISNPMSPTFNTSLLIQPKPSPPHPQDPPNSRSGSHSHAPAPSTSSSLPCHRNVLSKLPVRVIP